jgi:predicted deacylase
VQPFEIDGNVVKPGSRANLALPFMRTPDGGELTIPVIVMHGSAAGPALYLNSGTHGDEPEGTMAILDIAEELDPRVLKGTLVGVPALNVQAFVAKASVDVAGVRETPLDWKDLARVFPGKPDGTATERLAHAVCSKILPRVNYAIDFHSGGTRGTSYLISGFVGVEGELGRKSYEVAKLFPFETLWRVSPWAKFASACAERNVVAVVVETTGQGRADSGDVEALKVGIRNVMKSLGMIDGTVEGLPSTRRCIDTETYLYASEGGILRPRVETGNLVEEGQVIGEVLDIYGRVNEQIRSPLAGIVTGVRTKPVVWAGDPTFLVANFIPTPEGGLAPTKARTDVVPP